MINSFRPPGSRSLALRVTGEARDWTAEITHHAEAEAEDWTPLDPPITGKGYRPDFAVLRAITAYRARLHAEATPPVTCERCGRTWTPRQVVAPLRCPSCKNPWRLSPAEKARRQTAAVLEQIAARHPSVGETAKETAIRLSKRLRSRK